MCLASGRLCTDGMQEENNAMSNLQTNIAIYLTKTPFQLYCKLHNILMPLHIESDSCDHSGVGVFSLKQTT